MRKFFLFATMLSLVASCTKAPQGDSQDRGEKAANSEQPKDLYNGFAKDTVSNISDNLFLINDKWMLVTGGNESSFNTMTASWGGFGTIWQKPIAFMTIRDSRYTFEFLQREPVYTISFYEEGYKDKLQTLGSKSGRDSDKIKEVGLTPLKMPSGAMAFEEAYMIIECKKLLSQPIDPKNITDKTVADQWYSKEPGVHNLYFGEIVGVWKKDK
ncbi:flavin reductase family protein [Dysgonomonas sp. 520]|uniref:flavin reductase family protein n=1 Tax=Dysgonomonas sp. 520 TaxID=2302931 RepID=UPI0013D0D36D|nr:flavin reductase [Dysgonomonas sp. 520]NDW09294.1 hypothetical protein [Dysgonomonas sp. 520]